MMKAMNASILQKAKSFRPEEGRPTNLQRETSREQGTTGEAPAVPVGLSALLSAVTLQLKDGRGDETGSVIPKSSNMTTLISSTSSVPTQHEPLTHDTDGTDTEKSTPTIVPEVAKQLPLLESLMTLLMDENNCDILTFLPDGKFFAMRTQEFSTSLMKQYFSVDSFQSFLEALIACGFTRIETDQPGIEVFHHSLFCRGDWKKCEMLAGCLRQQPGGTSQPDVAQGSSTGGVEDRRDSFKRRLSPTHAEKVDSCQTNSQKAKLHAHFARNGSFVEETESPCGPVRHPREVSNDNYRTAARTIAAEKIIQNGRGHPLVVQQTSPLEQQAVADTTQTIVTAAIESLLRDEDHTRKTFLKHERALSRSSLPGVVPISKQLFDCKSAGPFHHEEGDPNGGSQTS